MINEHVSRTFSRVARCAFVFAACAGVSPSQGAAIVASGAGFAATTTAVNDFRMLLGGGIVSGANGSFGATRREINWDGVPNASSAPNLMPANFFNVNSPRGLLLATPGTGFQVSATTASGTPVRFGDTNPSYPTTFSAFSPERLFSPINSNITDVTFAVPGTTVPATVTGFGAVFTDVDNANTTSVQFFDSAGVSLGTWYAPSANTSVSFVGVYFNGGERIVRVRITTGTAALSPNDGPPVTDVVAMDDFIYSEPQLVTQAQAPALIHAYERNSQRLVGFFSNLPGIIVSSIPLAGLQPTDQVIGMDVRPSTGTLYAIVAPNSGTTARLVTIDRASGATTPVGAAGPIAFDPGAGHGMAFNPASTERIRLVSTADSNKRINASDGTLSGSDSPLVYAAGDPGAAFNPAIPHVAYTNQYFGSTQATLFGIDTARGTLVMIGSPGGFPVSPNTGILTTVGSLGITAGVLGGFDIQPGASDGLAIVQVGTASYLYRISLQTGAATIVGLIGDGSFAIDGMSVYPPSQCLDVDGDGRTDALTDGLVLLRAMFGLTGSTATDGVTTPASARASWGPMRLHLNAGCGMSLQP